MPIGSCAEAAKILDFHRSWLADQHCIIPKGWGLVGQGSYRDVYLNPTGNVVYKIEIGYPRKSEPDNRCNEVEYIAITEGAFHEYSEYLPSVSLYWVDKTPVLAMEYVPYPAGEITVREWDHVKWIEHDLVGFHDAFSESSGVLTNLRRRRGKDRQLVIVDLGGLGDPEELPWRQQGAA